MKKYTKSLADSIKKARGELDLTQEEVADISGVDTANIAKMETPIVAPTLSFPLSSRSSAH